MKIVILDGYTANPGDLSWSELEELGDLVVYDRTSPYQIIERAGEADAVLTNKVALGKDMLDMLTRLKYVGVMATGYSIVDIEYAKLLGVGVTNVPEYSSASVAQHCLALLLHGTNAVAAHSDSVRRGDWQKSPDFSYTVQALEELEGQSLGIVGFGSIGSRVAAIGKALGMRVLVSRHPDGRAPSRFEQGLGFELVDFGELSERAQVVSLHCPYTESSKGLVSRAWLENARGLKLLNTARGGLIDEDAVCDALDSGQLSYYAADSYAQEPPAGPSRLLGHRRAVLTPHVAWATLQARQRMIATAAANLRAFAAGERLNRLV